MHTSLAVGLLVLASTAAACGSEAEPRHADPVATTGEPLMSPEPAAPQSKAANVPELVDLSRTRRATPEETRRLDAIRAKLRARMEVK